MTDTEWIALIDRRNARAVGLRVWSLARDQQIADARVHPHADGVELKITIAGKVQWARVIGRQQVEDFLEPTLAGTRQDLIANGWQPIGWTMRDPPATRPARHLR
jgi:hypothetical protein